MAIVWGQLWTPEIEYIESLKVRNTSPKNGGYGSEQSGSRKNQPSGGYGVPPNGGYGNRRNQPATSNVESDRLDDVEVSSNKEVESNRFFLALYDLESRQLRLQQEVQSKVTTATFDESGVYASFSTSDPNDKRAKPTAVIVAFNRNTLVKVGQTEIEDLPIRMATIPGGLLAVQGKRIAGTIQYKIPSLEIVSLESERYPKPVSGRVSDGYRWNGILWDQRMKSPRLLLHSVAFANASRSLPRVPNRVMFIDESPLAVGKKPIIYSIYKQARGAACCTLWNLPQDIVALSSSPAGLSATLGQLNLFDHRSVSQVPIRNAEPDNAIGLVNPSWIEPLPSNRHYGQKLRSSIYQGVVSEADNLITVAKRGKLFRVPVDRLLAERNRFQFDEKQSRFDLKLSGKNKVSYSAPGATRYKLQLWSRIPSNFLDDKPLLTLESDDGQFEFELPNPDSLVALVRDVARINSSDRTSEQKMTKLTRHLVNVTPAFRELIGRRPTGIPVPIHVGVIADHEDGFQKAGLAHSYLVEIPGRCKQIRPTNPRPHPTHPDYNHRLLNLEPESLR